MLFSVDKLESCDQTLNSTYQKSGVITSEGYPRPYKAGTVCSYRLYGAINERVAIKFTDFQLSSSQDSTNLPR